jgi:Asp-tRNA(Asn)/Glu-tRNA(Gln) amidotransferase A subunit family amidase
MGLSIFAKQGEDAKLLQLARWYHENSDIHIDVLTWLSNYIIGVF